MAAPEFILSNLMIMIISFLLLPNYSAPLEFNYPALEQQNPNLTAQGNVTFLGSEEQLTKNKKDQIGRLRYFHQPMRLWETSSGLLMEADFITQFSFMIHSNDWAPGDGIAFFLAQPPFSVPKITDGSCAAFGTRIRVMIALYANRFAAVEFDTFKNDFDPRDLQEHVGLNVNSMVSRATASWSGYDQEGSHIEQTLSHRINLVDHLPERVVFGFSAANGLFTSKNVLSSMVFLVRDTKDSTTTI
ncbi:Galactose-binding lectin [Morus notabilis]|uniref:Galactose-binding lectin n=1 Tax=Morus notabilis TaxID=981085 RepID=W9SI54_9ROSA|nr:concanavalin-Br [Morus notabilis]EXC33013.1 Galactose-binding lectin [Morus notabilis]